MDLRGMAEIAVGDTVLVVHVGSWTRHIREYTVTHVTPKQFKAKIGNLEEKFRKFDGRQIGYTGSYPSYAYPDNQYNRAEYVAGINGERRRSRIKDLALQMIAFVRQIRSTEDSEELLDKLEQVARILELEDTPETPARSNYGQ